MTAQPRVGRLRAFAHAGTVGPMASRSVASDLREVALALVLAPAFV